MSSGQDRRLAVLATALFALTLATMASAIWFGLQSEVEPATASDVVDGLILLGFPAVGWLIAVKQPRNLLGWVYMLFPFLIGISVILFVIAMRAATGGLSSRVAIFLILGSWVTYLGYWLPLGPGILLFPDGRIPGRRFKQAFWGLTALLITLGVVETAGRDRLCVQWFDIPRNPCTTQWVPNPLALVHGEGVGVASDWMLVGAFLLVLLTSVGALAARYVRSSGDVRQQLKWIAWAAGAGLVSMTALAIIQDAAGWTQTTWADVIGFSPIALGVPAAVGVAIFKYRLYDIDRIISRTAAYSVIVALLAGVYVAGVALAQRILPAKSPLGVVASTLIVAALFTPLRRRVQDEVDRRFNRPQYDARRVLDQFSSSLRDVVDPEQMELALLAVVHETMHPSSLSLWLPEEEER